MEGLSDELEQFGDEMSTGTASRKSHVRRCNVCVVSLGAACIVFTLLTFKCMWISGSPTTPTTHFPPATRPIAISPTIDSKRQPNVQISTLIEYRHPFLPSREMKDWGKSQLTLDVERAFQEPMQRRFHIVATVYNNLQAFRVHLQHLLEQMNVNFRKVHLHVIDDASTEFNSKELLDVLQAGGQALQFTYFRNQRRMGPGYSKWFLFDFLRDVAGLNDVILVVDGDDHLVGRHVLSALNDIYLKHKPYFTYGSCVGKYCDQQKLFSPGGKWREEWVYSHPRSFIAAVLQHLTPADFQDKAGVWLFKGTDRGFVYKALDFAGPSRVRFVERVLYNYTESMLSSYKHMAAAQRLNIMHDMDARPQITRAQSAVHVVMCIFDRPDNLEWILRMLDGQDVDELPVYLWICNNNPEIYDQLLNYTRIADVAVVCNIFDMPTNMGGFGRFVLAEWLLRTTIRADYIVMLDDDILFHDEKGLKSLLSSAKARSYNCWYGRRFHRGQGYWANDLITGEEITQGLRPDVNTYHYCGTGLSIVDAAVFESEALLRIPTAYMFVEDLWLSALALQHGFELNRVFLKAEMLPSRTELWYAQGMRDKKDAFLSLLRDSFSYPY